PLGQSAGCRAIQATRRSSRYSHCGALPRGTACARMWREGADRQSSHRFSGILAAARWGHVVSFINNQKIIRTGIGRFFSGRKRLPERTEWPLTLKEIDRCDEPREVAPGIDMNPALTTQLADSVAVDNSKLKPELVPHLVSPLQLQRGRADDQNRSNPVTQNHLLHHKARLHGL